ncbi:MAG: T9SS type A sorting domain-containing protein [Bacteroidetes bacterium]|nr:T9SS type A sorting domain-containing protein [Bacteroidota bacterium]
MKSAIVLLLAFFLFTSKLSAQDYLIVSDPALGGYQMNFSDTSFTDHEFYCSSITRDFDLDRDSSMDVRFYLTCYYGGQGDYAEIKVTSMGSFKTLFIPDFEIPSVVLNYETYKCDTVVKHYALAKRFENGDTINLQLESTKETIYMVWQSMEHMVFCPGEYAAMINDTPCALAFYKEEGNKTYLYYAIITGDKYTVDIHSVWSNDPRVNSINMLNTAKVEFPNPTSGSLHFEGDFDQVQFLTSTGEIVLSQELSGNSRQIDISKFPRGIYFMKLRKGNNWQARKIIKI